MQVQNCPALVLNADFQPLSHFPLSLVSWQDAVQAVFKQRVSVVAEYGEVIRSPSHAMRLPSVIALRAYQAQPSKVAFTRFNLFLRDRFRCQYCGAKFATADLTFDHVVPRCEGGRTTWENVVAACSACNQRKDRFHAMKPLQAPRKPTSHELLAAKRRYPPKYLHETWQDFLWWDSELES